MTMHIHSTPLRKYIHTRTWPLLAGCFFLLFSTTGCKKAAPTNQTVLNVPSMGDVGSMDPINTDSLYDSWSSGQVTEPLLQYHYTKRPLTLEPLLIKSMPAVSADKKTYTFELKPGISFHDNRCFPGGKGRELVAKDVFYSFRRMANRALNPTPTGWWIFNQRVVGLDAYRAEQYQLVKSGKKFDYDAPIAGFQLYPDNKYKFSIALRKPFPQFLDLLAFQKTAVVPRECVEYYAQAGRGGFGQNPVGTGPFRFKRWIQKVRIVFERNPNYGHSTYPTDGFDANDIKEGLNHDAGKKLPFVDVLVMHIFFGQPQPAWIKFSKQQLDYITVAREYFKTVYTDNHQLRDKIDGIPGKVKSASVPLLDFIYEGFNFLDPVVGGNSEKARYLRLAMIYAHDFDEINHRFYNNQSLIYQGAIPPGLEGHGGKRFKRDLKKAKEYLAKAGYPEGKGLPELVVSTSGSSEVKDREDTIKRQYAEIGIKVRYDLSTFPQLSSKLRKGQVQMFSLAWGSDYPDAENNLMLFYGPNKAPGPNSWNYQNPAYDKLFEQARDMFPSPERTALYHKLNQMLIDDGVFVGSLARTRRYLSYPYLKNFKPDETIGSYWKYLRVPPQKDKHKQVLPPKESRKQASPPKEPRKQTPPQPSTK